MARRNNKAPQNQAKKRGSPAGKTEPADARKRREVGTDAKVEEEAKDGYAVKKPGLEAGIRELYMGGDGEEGEESDGGAPIEVASRVPSPGQVEREVGMIRAEIQHMKMRRLAEGVLKGWQKRPRCGWCAAWLWNYGDNCGRCGFVQPTAICRACARLRHLDGGMCVDCRRARDEPVLGWLSNIHQ